MRGQERQNDNCNGLLYFFHSDHLGSSSFITDADGEAYEFINYLPFGELMAEQSTASFGTPYKFNGKELDEETGLYDYGARYYDPSLSLFPSVDRFADKFPWQSPHTYASNNPVTFIDMNGDSTRVYNLNGDYMDTINDDLPNEDHFMSEDMYDLATSFADNDEAQALMVRTFSSYYIGKTAKAKIKSIYDSSVGNGEKGFLMYLASGSREVQIKNISEGVNSGSTEFNMRDAVLRNGEVDGVAIGVGHTHPNNFFARGPAINREWIDYYPYVLNSFTGKYGGNPFMIAHRKGMKIYPSAQFKGESSDFRVFGNYGYGNFEYVGKKANAKPRIRY